ncbi:Di-and tricarboxylate transporter [Amphritea atlantica]|uniref:Di-and tricarboxylate transporter n=1 Tax=Amphritea atlantica TaxID=355243 RepID=A0A1H9EDA9_9GAMM|nr:SLC13 family permease [Amphritea atlantica]SEQ23736.1 Di-and tricarboxylate transporter [Amphritea atlantica]
MMPAEIVLNTHAIAVLLLTALALFLFTRDWLPLESSSLFVLAALATGFQLFPYTADGKTIHAVDFFSGFGHEALIAVTALMIIGHALARTGALEPVGRALTRLWQVSPKLSFLLTLIVGAALSAFVNNVPIVILLLPILISVSLQTKTSASGILMPMGFATLIGGMGTTIGTSTNLLVVSVAVSMGMAPFSMFEFIGPVALSSLLAIIYLWLVAPRILPERASELGDASPRIFSAALHINEDGFSDGKTVEEVIEQTDKRVSIKYVRRAGSDALTVASRQLTLKPGDQLLVSDTPENLKAYEQLLDADLYGSETKIDEDHPLQAEGQQLAEIIIAQGSPLLNTSVSKTRFADRYQLVVLALHRVGPQSRQAVADIDNTQLQLGDVLLVQGASETIAELKQQGKILVLDATSHIPHSEKAPLALMIMIAVVAISALGLLPIAISAVCGVLLLALTNCLGWKDMAEAVNAQIILIVAASLALGFAMLETGAADAMAAGFVYLTADLSVTMQLSGLMLLMAIMTNIVSNNAAAVIGTPIAIGIANQLGMPVEPFVLAVLFGANMSYATPMAYKTNLLVMTVGGYSFNDFLKVGIPLTIIMWLSLSFLIPVFYPVG